MSTHDNVNHIVMASDEDGSPIRYRFNLDGGEVREFDDAERAIEFSGANGVYDLDIVFPNGRIRTVTLHPPIIPWGERR